MPIVSATRRAAPSPPWASAGETAVTARARSPSPRRAAAATTEESTPPENATTAPPVEDATATSRVSASAVSIGGGERGGPDLLDGTAGLGCDGRAVVVLGRDVDHATLEEPELHPDAVAEDVHLAHLAVELVAVQARDADAERGAVFEQRGGDRHLGVGSSERTEDHAGAALLHRGGRGPHVDRAGRAASFGGVGDQLGHHVVDVRLEEENVAFGGLGPGRRPEDRAHDVRPVR